MTGADPGDELGYHLRELRADLGLVQRDLDTIAAEGAQTAGRRALIQAWALLEHDLDVHVARLLALTGAAGAGTSTPRAGDDDADPRAAAVTAARHVQAALAELDDGLPLDARKANELAGAVTAAHRALDAPVRLADS